MPIISVNAKLPWKISGESSSNTFHFDTGATTPSEANTEAYAQAIGAFYNAGLNGYWSFVLQGGVDVSAINLSDAQPRTAYGLWSFTLTPNADSVPTECALNVGIRAPREAGVPAQRHRGTLQFGPLGVAVLAQPGNFSDAFMDDAEAAVQELVDQFDLLSFTWVVGTAASGYEPITTVRLRNEPGTVGKRQGLSSDERTITI